MVGGKVTKKLLPPKTLPGVRFIDVGRKGGPVRVGGGAFPGGKIGSVLSSGEFKELQKQASREKEFAIKAEEQAKRESIEKQKKFMEKERLRLEQNRIFADKLRAMDIQKRQEFIKRQAEIAKAQSLQILQQKGKTLTPESKVFLERTQQRMEAELGKEVIIQRQIDIIKGIPILETVVRNEKTGKERKPSQEEFRLIREQSLTILPAKTQRQIFTDLKKVYTPTFFGSSFIANKVQNVIGGSLASGVYAEKELGKRLFNLRDANGQRIFNETQALNSGKLISEIIKGFVLGLGTGKALKLLGLGAKQLGKIKGVTGIKSFEQFVNPSVSKLLPRVLTGTEKQILSRTAQIGLIGGLTAIETNRIINTARTDGKKAVLLQLIGLTSFIKGASVGAKDFKKLSPKQKKAIRMNVKQFELNIVKTQDKKTIELLNKAKIKISKELKQFKGVKRIKKISKIPKKIKDLGAKPPIEKVKFRELNLNERDKLIKDSARKQVRKLEKKFNKVLSQKDRSKLEKQLRKVLRNKLNAGEPILKLEREFIQGKKSYIKRLVAELKRFKGIKRIKKIKKVSKEISKKIEAKKRRAKIKISKELKQFKGVKRIKKIKRAKQIRIKESKIREVVRLDNLAFQAKQKEIDFISKRIAGALERSSGIKLGTHKRGELIKNIRKEIVKRSGSKIELRKFQNKLKKLLESGKKEIVSFKVIKEKPRISKKKVKPSKPDKRKPLFKVTKIKEPKVSREVRARESGQQQLLLEPQVKAKIRAKAKVFQILDPNSQQFKILQKSSKVKNKQVQQMKIKHRSLQRQKLKMETQIKVLQRDLVQIRAIPRFKIKQKQLMKSLSDIKIKIKILSDSIIKSASLIRSLSRDLILIDSRIKISIKAKQKLITVPTTKPAVPLLKLKKKVKKKTVLKKDIPYNVFARPLKKKGQKVPRLVRVNNTPLSKERAEDLASYLVDQSLARTARPKVTTGKIDDSSIKGVPVGYAKKTKGKFRKVRIVKGKARKLPSGTIIEKTKHILDTGGEKKGITVRRLASQVNKKVRVKPKINSKSPHRITKKPKRTLSQAQSDALANGRKKRLDNLKK